MCKCLQSHLSLEKQAIFLNGNRFIIVLLLQDNSTQQYRVCSGNCFNEDKHVACTPPLFSRPGPVEPLFARPAPVEFHCFKDGMVEGAKKNDTLHSKECPKFARPGGATCERKQFISCGEQISSPQTHIKGK